MKALANHYDAKLLVFDNSSMPSEVRNVSIRQKFSSWNPHRLVAMWKAGLRKQDS